MLLLLAGTALAQSNPRTTQDLLKELYGLVNAPYIQESNVTVGTTPVQIRTANAARVELVVSNTGTSNCSVSTSDLVTITQGTVLGSGGGILVEGFRDDLLIPTQEHWAVCAAAGGTLHIVEFILG